jgi:flavin-dependent dehydrogenase
MEKIKILGAGPSGLTAAINLARAGFPVEVYEKRDDAGGRFHGDLQGLENWSETKDTIAQFQEMNLRINFDCCPYHDLSLTNGEELLHFSCHKPAFYLVKRGTMSASLDQGLKEQALDSGVTIFFSSPRSEEEADIIATGPGSEGFLGVVKGFTFTTTMENIAVALINTTASRDGYAYLLVMNGYGCLCTYLMSAFHQAGACLDEARQTFSRMFPLEIIDPKPCGGFGRSDLYAKFREGTRLYVGEAARLQDMFGGFGIRYAVQSGYLAAQAIIHGNDYETLAMKCFLRKFKAGIVNRYLFEKLGRKNYSLVYEKLRNVQDPLPKVCSFYNFNRYQRVLYPLAVHYLNRTRKRLKSSGSRNFSN